MADFNTYDYTAHNLPYPNNSQENIDLIENITKLAQAIETNLDDIDEEQTTQNDNIATNTEDIETLKEDNEYLKSIVDQLPSVSGTGEEVTLEPTIVARLREIAFKGQASQKQYQGYNKVDFKTELLASKVQNGITYTNNGDGSFNASGTATTTFTLPLTADIKNHIDFTKKYMLFGENVTYNGTNFNLSVRVAFNDGTSTKFIVPNNAGTAVDFSQYDSSTIARVDLALYIQNGITITTSTNVKLMLITEDTFNIPYEPYVGGIASPNPSYPQEIKVVRGKNLLENKINANINSEGIIVSHSTYALGIAKVFQGNKYTISGSADSVTAIGFFRSYPQIGDTSYNNSRKVIEANPVTFMADITGYVVFRILQTDTNVQIEEGEVATSYMAYNTIGLKFGNKNICNVSGWQSFSASGINVTIDSDGDLVLNGTSTSIADIYFSRPDVNTKGDEIANYINNNLGSYVMSNNLGLENYFKSGSSYERNTITITDTKKLSNDGSRLFVRIPSGRTYNNQKLYIQIEKGSTATDYVPHQEQNFALSLGSMEFAAIDDTRDKIVRLADGSWKKYKVFNKKVLDGTEEWTSTASIAPNTIRYLYNDSDIYNSQDGADNNIYMLSTMFKALSWNEIYTTDTTTLYAISNWNSSGATTGRVVIRIPTSIANSVQDFKTWLSENLPPIYYRLAEPVYESISEPRLLSQLEYIYQNARTYLEQTNVSQDGGDLPFILDITAMKQLS